MDDQTSNVSAWIGLTAVGPDGGKIGKIQDVYADDDTGQSQTHALTKDHVSHLLRPRTQGETDSNLLSALLDGVGN